MPQELAPSPGNRLHRLMRRVEANAALDPVADRLAPAVGRGVDAAGARPLLTGTWLGHACHPLLTDFADGAWMAGSFLDLFGPRSAAPAARRLVGFGLLAAVPTALTGLAEWADTEGKERRVGVLHAATSTTAFLLYGCSYVARRRGRTGAGVALGVMGGVMAFADGYFGGHLSLALGVGVGQTAFERFPTEWTHALDAEELPDDAPTKASVRGTDLVMVRTGGQVFALADRCAYRGGSLHDGHLSDQAIVCPRHGCTYRLADGAVLRGPASIPQPSLATRVDQGRVEVRAER